LSVSTSQIAVPAENESPSLISHFDMEPCSIVGDSAGIPTSSCCGNDVENLLEPTKDEKDGTGLFIEHIETLEY
jgi:hypothetical protein